MSTETKELLELCERLPQAKRIEVTDFARFLLAQESDVRWEQIVASPDKKPKLDSFLQKSAREQAGPLDVDGL